MISRAVKHYEVYLRDGHETPMSFAYNTSVILRIIRRNEFSVSSFTFTDVLGREVSHHGNTIHLDKIREMIEGQLDKYQKKLKDTFFFGEDIPAILLPEFDIEGLVDNIQSRSIGYTFIEDPRNGLAKYKDNYAKWFLSDKRRREQFTEHNGLDLVWKPAESIELIDAFQSLDLELAAGLVFSAGPSSRGSEFCRHLYRDMPGAIRNLGVVHHRISLNATTDKSSHQRLLDLFVPHIPTRKWAIVLLRHLCVIRPFVEYLVETLFGFDQEILRRYYHYLWPGIQKPMSNHDLSEKMSEITFSYLSKGYGIKFWRSFTTTILQYHADGETSQTNRQYFFDTVNMHSTLTANAKYGGNTDNMLGADSRMISGCVSVGLTWHRLVGIEDYDAPSPPLASSASVAGLIQPANLIEQIKSFKDESLASMRASVSETMAEFSVMYFPPPPRPRTALPIICDIEVHPSRLADFRLFMGDPKAKWSCPEQAAFVEYVVGGRENVLGILGTGFGKTTIIMFISKHYSNGKSTVVIMPLASLHEDFASRARQYGLKASRWNVKGTFDSTSHIITAAVEDLMNEEFVQ